jgi:hypothetical protein
VVRLVAVLDLALRREAAAALAAAPATAVVAVTMVDTTGRAPATRFGLRCKEGHKVTILLPSAACLLLLLLHLTLMSRVLWAISRH